MAFRSLIRPLHAVALGCALLFTQHVFGSDATEILSVGWQGGPSRVSITFAAKKGENLRVENAYDSTQVLGSNTLSEDTWQTTFTNPNPVPCRVRVVNSSTGEDIEADVSNAPANCAPTEPGGGGENQPPVSIIGGPYSGLVGDKIHLDGRDSYDPDGSVVKYVFVYGDGSKKTNFKGHSNHVYTAPGTYSVRLMVFDNDGATNSSWTDVVITAANTPPVSDPGGPYSGTAGEPVQFDGSGSYDPDGSISNYIWEFGDGNEQRGVRRITPEHTYAAPGTYTVTLTVVDDASPPPRGQSVSTTTATIAGTGGGNNPPTANAGPDQTVTLASGQTNTNVILDGSGSSDPDGDALTYNWIGNPNPANTVSPTVSLGAGSYTFSLTVSDGQATSAADTVNVTVNAAPPPTACVPADTGLSINTTSQNGCPDGTVAEQPQVANNTYSVLAINDLGMHCGDLDTRISSILPPFQVLLAQVVQKGASPTLNPAGVSVRYSAASNPADPILASDVFDGVLANGDTYKTNFWDGVTNGTYDPFYPGGLGITPLATGGFPVVDDVSLPVPNAEDLYIGPDGLVNSGDEFLSAVQHLMPGIADPYNDNVPLEAQEHYVDKPFFVNFPFGYVAADVNWFEGAGIPLAAFDDNGRENAYPLFRVEAVSGGSVLSTVDTVLPISGEASCTNCHSTNTDYTSVHGEQNRTDIPTDALATAGLPVATSLDDPDSNMPPKVSLEYAADINILRLHDLKHGANYVAPSAADDGTTVAAPCDINANAGNGDASCLTNQALEANKPVVCQVCHYTPALDLAQFGPMTGPEGSMANGRNQLSHKSNSNVMHSHHGGIADLDRNGVAMFPAIPHPDQDVTGMVLNQGDRLDALDNSCYQCHPGKSVQCLRGAMFNGGMLCSDCHGTMEQVGSDFSRDVTPSNPGAFDLHGNFYTDATQPRVPWANEPGCGSCHTGDASNNMAGNPGTTVNTRDTNGALDGIRLRVAFLDSDAKATPIIPSNKRFAEPEVQASFNGFNNPGAGNPQLYRVSTGHGGVMCEGCHGATHSEWPNANPASNDNSTSMQLQGHAGTIADCSVCHGNNNPGNNLNGPHGLHRIAYDSTPWSSSNVHKNPGENFSSCATCHGGTSRNNSCGTVLSRALSDRTFSGRTIRAGEPVGCAVCHSGSYWNSTCVNQ